MFPISTIFLLKCKNFLLFLIFFYNYLDFVEDRVNAELKASKLSVNGSELYEISREE